MRFFRNLCSFLLRDVIVYSMRLTDKLFISVIRTEGAVSLIVNTLCSFFISRITQFRGGFDYIQARPTFFDHSFLRGLGARVIASVPVFYDFGGSNSIGSMGASRSPYSLVGGAV